MLRRTVEMKRSMMFSVLGILALVLFVGCAKQPTEEIDKAKAAANAAITGGADKYAPEEAKALNSALNAALDEAKAQEAKWFKSYDKTKEMLSKVAADAEALKGATAKKKEEAKQKATAGQEEAKAAVEEAKQLLAKAPKGKGSQADIEAMKADVKGLEDGLAEVDKLLGSEDFLQVIEKTKAIKDKAAGVSEQINAAMAKKGGKPAKK